MNGVIIKIDSSTSYVLYNDIIYTAHAKGNLKKDSKPCVGDFVIFDVIDEVNKIINIIKIQERKTELYRPKIANVDQVVIVTSLLEPLFASYILNKYIAMLEIKQIQPILVFTKMDLLIESNKHLEVWEKISNYQTHQYRVLIVNNNAPEQSTLDELKSILENKISVFTGQTGAGKSSTLNNFLIHKEKIKTQEISKNLNRGKHTTTAVELYKLPKNILIADTPGFSSFELQDIEIEDLLFNFSFFKKYRNQCKFTNCQHINELKCAVKDAVANSELPQFIYDDYLKMIEEIKNRKVKY
ncbi:ribosome small subunit-dependent GTPase A [Mesoplasma syrphidae]|uniref:Small ribosomal subunit biogenesis GTPase RsgA n=1 Tax=Mesoplasma syrphidae TaxID=225999 RepID=A0A2K9BQW1_9MOLU|nr:ribosome small subunit-dependent GTPase A [Mesoplasma syrphidae]AUF83392.1 ribosome small subunit-dependent GTPase A [Mesoplasma syrphidae]